MGSVTGDDAKIRDSCVTRDVGFGNEAESVAAGGIVRRKALGKAADFFGTGKFPAGTLRTGAEILVFGEDVRVRMGGFVALIKEVVGEKCVGEGRNGLGRLGFSLTLGVGQDLAELRE